MQAQGVVNVPAVAVARQLPKLLASRARLAILYRRGLSLACCSCLTGLALGWGLSLQLRHTLKTLLHVSHMVETFVARNQFRKAVNAVIRGHRLRSVLGGFSNVIKF